MRLVPIHSHTNSIFEQILQQDRVRRHIDPIACHNQDTYFHLLDVCKFTIDLGLENHLKMDQLLTGGYAGILHDIGKVGIPNSIISKPGRLTEAERAAMDQHPRLGFLQLQDPEYVQVRNIIVAHHEYQRRAYPRSGTDPRQGDRRSQDRRTFCCELPADRRYGQRRTDERRIVERRQTDAATSFLAQMLAAADIRDALSRGRNYVGSLSDERIKEIFRQEYLGPQLFVNQVMRRTYG